MAQINTTSLETPVLNPVPIIESIGTNHVISSKHLNLPSPYEATTKYRSLNPFRTGDIKILLLEGISKVAIDMLTDAGYQVEHHSKALPLEVLKEKLKTVHAVGIRSKTQLSEELIASSPTLLTIGCFCIGTNQVHLDSLLSRGISVFNSPFSNSRSVAELIIAEIITLSRGLSARNIEMHRSEWKKTSVGCHEIRGKCLGIVGYGHIGTQLSVLAEAMGLRVIYYDINQMMPLGMAERCSSLAEVLTRSDFVSLHVPQTPETKGMIGNEQMKMMKKGSYLLNASRGCVVDLVSLKELLQEGHLAGAAIDVFPEEPAANGTFSTGFEEFNNVILSPHIGGSTLEAQDAIGAEVAQALIRYLGEGNTQGSVNFPEMDLRTSLFNCHNRKADTPDTASEEELLKVFPCRLINVHRNVPGVLRKMNNVLGDFNIEKQICESKGEYSYFMADIKATDPSDIDSIYEGISSLPEALSTRITY